MTSVLFQLAGAVAVVFGAVLSIFIAGLLVASRVTRIAPVSKEMVLNFVAMHSLGLPKSY